MRNRWPNDRELNEAKLRERKRAIEHNEEEDPICECGEPGWACCCDDIARHTGHYSDGTPYDP